LGYRAYCNQELEALALSPQLRALFESFWERSPKRAWVYQVLDALGVGDVNLTCSKNAPEGCRLLLCFNAKKRLSFGLVLWLGPVCPFLSWTKSLCAASKRSFADP